MAPVRVPTAATAHHHTLDAPWSTPDVIDRITHATTQRIVPVATAGMAVSSGDNEERGSVLSVIISIMAGSDMACRLREMCAVTVRAGS